MNQKNNSLKPRTQHNADAAYYVLDYLAHSFPTQLYEPYTDSEGNLSSRPVYRDGQPVESREAAARRDELIERLASLPPVPGALDQIVQRFGTDMVAEVTGRSRASWSSPTLAVPGAAIMPSCRRETGACASTISSNRAGRRMPPFRGSAVPTGRTRRSRPCSVRSRPM